MPWAIDAHIHPSADPRAQRGRAAQTFADAQKYFKGGKITPIEETAAHYRELDMIAVLLALDSESGSGRLAITNDFVAEIAQQFPDVFIGFGSVDPWKGKMAVDEVKRAVEELGLKGFKFQPITQAFSPNDHQFYSIYEAMAGYRLPVIFHSGTTGIGAGTPGGGGYRLKYGRPILLDDVAADFPDMPLVIAHPSWPWHEEALAIAVHKANVSIDLSGWSPKYFPESVVRYANSLLQDKVMFGSDYPYVTPEKWLTEFEKLPIKEEVKPKILFDNARRLLGLNIERSEPPASLATAIANPPV